MDVNSEFRLDQIHWQPQTVCSVLQRPTPNAVAAPRRISPKLKKARTSNEDDVLLLPFESLTGSQQRLTESVLLSRLADDIRDCTVQVLQISGFMKYFVLSTVLHVPAGSCMNDRNMSTPVFESLTTLHELSVGDVSVLAIDMHLLQNYQIVHAVCFCGELNI